MKRISEDFRTVDLTGHFLAYSAGKPLMLKLEDTLFLPVFSTPEKLTETFELAGVTEMITIKIITDVGEFLDSVHSMRGSAHTMRVMMDPWVTEEGNTRFTEVLANPSASTFSPPAQSPPPLPQS